jgi:hypothetical protein
MTFDYVVIKVGERLRPDEVRIIVEAARRTHPRAAGGEESSGD